MKKWESEKHRSWGLPVEGFKGHVATDGSLLGKTGKWRACGWEVVQLDYDEEMGPFPVMYGLSGGGTRGPAHHQSGWSSQGPEREMQTNGKMEGITWYGRKRHFGGSGACKGTPHEEV